MNWPIRCTLEQGRLVPPLTFYSPTKVICTVTGLGSNPGGCVQCLDIGPCIAPGATDADEQPSPTVVWTYPSHPSDDAWTNSGCAFPVVAIPDSSCLIACFEVMLGPDLIQTWLVLLDADTGTKLGSYYVKDQFIAPPTVPCDCGFGPTIYVSSRINIYAWRPSFLVDQPKLPELLTVPSDFFDPGTQYLQGMTGTSAGLACILNEIDDPATWYFSRVELKAENSKITHVHDGRMAPVKLASGAACTGLFYAPGGYRVFVAASGVDPGLLAFASEHAYDDAGKYGLNIPDQTGSLPHGVVAAAAGGAPPGDTCTVVYFSGSVLVRISLSHSSSAPPMRSLDFSGITVTGCAQPLDSDWNYWIVSAIPDGPGTPNFAIGSFSSASHPPTVVTNTLANINGTPAASHGMVGTCNSAPVGQPDYVLIWSIDDLIGQVS